MGGNGLDISERQVWVCWKNLGCYVFLRSFGCQILVLTLKMYWNSRMVWHVSRSSTLLEAKNVVATWCGLHKDRGPATRTTIVLEIVASRGLLHCCPILHKQEATGNRRRTYQMVFQKSDTVALCPAQDSWVASLAKIDAGGLRRIV